MRWAASDGWFKRTEEWFSIPRAIRSIHDDLERWCQLHGKRGVVDGSRSWPDSRWHRVGDCSRRSVAALVAQGLARWVGDDLELLHYAHEWEEKYEAIVTRNRNNGRNGAEKQKAAKAAESQKRGDASGYPSGHPIGGATDGRTEDLDLDLGTDPPLDPSRSEPPTTPPNPPAGRGGGGGPVGFERGGPDPAGWVELVAAYPPAKHVPENDHAVRAQLAALELQPDEVATMLAELQTAKASDEWRREGGKYAKEMSRWVTALAQRVNSRRAVAAAEAARRDRERRDREALVLAQRNAPPPPPAEPWPDEPIARWKVS